MFLDDLRGAGDLYRKIVAGKRLGKKEQDQLEGLRAQYGISAEGTVQTQEALAELLGVTRQSIIRWKKDGMPVEVDGSYDPIKVLAWKSDLFDDDDDGPEGSEKTKWDTNWRKFRALLAEEQYKKEIGLSIDRAEVEQLLVTRVVELKQSLLGMSRSLSPRLAHKDAEVIQAIIDEYVLELLRVYSRPNTILRKPTAESTQGAPSAGSTTKD